MRASPLQIGSGALTLRSRARGEEAKKKVYPINYLEEETEEAHVAEEESFDEEQYLQQLADQGDEDANFVADYETMRTRSWTWCRSSRRWPSASTPTLQRETASGRRHATVVSGPPRSKEEKVAKVVERREERRPFGARLPTDSHCRICGQKGRWRMECPQRNGGSQSSGGTEVSNFGAPMDQETEPMEIVMETPKDSITLAEMMLSRRPLECNSEHALFVNE